MIAKSNDLSTFEVIGFDTMGTLLDERTGIYTAFEPTARQLQQSVSKEDLHRRLNKTLKQYLGSSFTSLTYRTLLAKAHHNVTLDLSSGQHSPSEESSLAFADALADWPAFPDTVAAMQSLAQRSKLVLLSNMDTSTLEAIASRGALRDVPIAACVGCDKTGGFKPDHKVNQALLDVAQKDFGVTREKVLLVAQGLKSDHVPAAEMGIASAWIDRYGGGEQALEDAGVRPSWVFERLQALVDERDGTELSV